MIFPIVHFLFFNSCDVSEKTLAFVYLHFNESLIDIDTRANYARNLTNKRSTLYQEMNEWIDSREWNHRFLWVQTSARLKPTVLWSRIADNNTIPTFAVGFTRSVVAAKRGTSIREIASLSLRSGREPWDTEASEKIDKRSWYRYNGRFVLSREEPLLQRASRVQC